MASADREPIRGIWGQSPQRAPGAEPLVRGSEAPWSWWHFYTHFYTYPAIFLWHFA